jgi:hypothetical protein
MYHVVYQIGGQSGEGRNVSVSKVRDRINETRV